MNTNPLQPNLFDPTPLISPEYEKGESLEVRFQRFHTLNPQVYRQLRNMARAMKARGFRHYGMKALYEVLRFHHAIQTTDSSGYKLNNNYAAFYARLLMAENPDLEGFFEIRRMRNEEGDFTEEDREFIKQARGVIRGEDAN